MEPAIELFCCYARKDKSLLNQLKNHLMPLQRQGLIHVWYDGDISAGVEWEQEIENQLEAARIILLLVSPDFIASDYCYRKEMKRALERHESGEARVIPIILRSVYWKDQPFSKLQVLPFSGKPITHASWRSRDEAFSSVVDGIRKVIDDLAPINYQEYLKKIVPAYRKAMPYRLLCTNVQHRL
jgi:hypothetical protein